MRVVLASLLVLVGAALLVAAFAAPAEAATLSDGDTAGRAADCRTAGLVPIVGDARPVAGFTCVNPSDYYAAIREGLVVATPADATAAEPDGFSGYVGSWKVLPTTAGDLAFPVLSTTYTGTDTNDTGSPAYCGQDLGAASPSGCSTPAPTATSSPSPSPSSIATPEPSASAQPAGAPSAHVLERDAGLEAGLLVGAFTVGVLLVVLV